MGEIIPFNPPSNTGGSGPEDPMIERIERLEGKLSSIEITLAEIKATLGQLPKMSDYATLKADLARIEGRVSTQPSWWMLLIAVIATWGAGAGIVYALT